MVTYRKQRTISDICHNYQHKLIIKLLIRKWFGTTVINKGPYCLHNVPNTIPVFNVFVIYPNYHGQHVSQCLFVYLMHYL